MALQEIFLRVQSPYTIAIAIPALFVCAIYFIWRHDAPHRGFRVIGLEPGDWTHSEAKKKFNSDARGLLMAGLQTKGPFQLLAPAGPEIVLPSDYANEVKNDKRLNFDGMIKRDFFPYIPGFEGIKSGMDNRVIQDTVRVKLTQSLNLITRDLCEETEYAVSKIFGESKDWNSIYFMQTCPTFVARLSSRVFLGPVVARDEEWLPIAVSYTINLMRAARALKQWNYMLRSIVHWFLPECKDLRAQYKSARKIINQEIERRRQLWEADKKAGRPVSKTADSLGWMQELGHGKNFDLAGGQLALTFAAIHTTSDLITKSMVRLATSPEIADALRKEMIEVLGNEGMKKTSLYQMKLLDSFLKEVQRLEPAGLTLINRTADEPVQLQDGNLIPKGAVIRVVGNKSFDGNVFPDPQKFDPYRFLKLRSQPGQENNWQFVTVAPESLGFGLGMHACPGRFFASNEVKIALCWLLMKYEWKLEDGAVSPGSIELGFEIMANPMTKLVYRRRKEELDMLSLFETYEA